MNMTGKKILWILSSCLMVFVISTTILLGVVISKQRESNYHKKYIELLATVKYYDYQSKNKIASLIANLKESEYYNEGVYFEIRTENGSISKSVYPSVSEIERTINQVEECRGKTEWSLDKKERFDCFLSILRIDNSSKWFNFSEKFYTGNGGRDGINLFTALGNIEWSDYEGNKLSFIMEEPVLTEEGSYTRLSSADKLVINFGGKVITSWAGQTNVEVANVLSGNDIKIQCNKDTTADNFRITSLKFELGVWYLTVEEVVSETEINVYVLSTTFE